MTSPQRCPLCRCAVGNGHACSTVQPLPPGTVVDHMGQMLRAVGTQSSRREQAEITINADTRKPVRRQG